MVSDSGIVEKLGLMAGSQIRASVADIWRRLQLLADGNASASVRPDEAVQTDLLGYGCAALVETPCNDCKRFSVVKVFMDDISVLVSEITVLLIVMRG